MPAHAAHETVQVTIDGVKYNITPGVQSLAEIIAAAKLNKKTAKLSVVAPIQASTINGNDSYAIVGGEVMTSTLGA